jgi:hypothetical protein
MAALHGLSARIRLLMQDARISFSEGLVDIDVPRIEVAIPREDCANVTRRMIPEGFALTSRFGIGQRVTAKVSKLHQVEMDFQGNEIHFQAQPDYRLQLDQRLPALGWRKLAAIKGKVQVPGLVRFRLENPGASLPEVAICCEVIPGTPDVLNPPDWAETTFKPSGQTIRNRIREALNRQELIRPFARFAGSELLQKVQVQELLLATDATHVRLEFAVVAQVPK